MDPAHTCGDDETAATKDYRIETSTDGVTFKVAKEGTLPHLGRKLNIVPPDGNATGVQFVRLTMLSPQSPSPATPAADFIDFWEIEIFGGPPNALPDRQPDREPEPVTPGRR